MTGRVLELRGLVLRACLPGARAGDVCEIERPDRTLLSCEVVGFREDEVVLMPLGEVRGIGPDATVLPTGRPFQIACGEGLLGRVLDGLGAPIDGRPLPAGLEPWDVDRPAPDPLSRRRVTRPLSLGVRAIDGLCTVGQGQRLGLFAGSGVGKSVLLGQIARQAAADVVVICLCGERGREVGDFLEESLGANGLARAVVVCATSDAPALVRLRSVLVATSIAEWFSNKHEARVLLLVDSVTRFARAQREVGLAAGEPPARQGYPPSVFAALPRLLERAGDGGVGSITAIYTVLVAGGDLEEPIADEVRGILDGHVILSRELAQAGHFPAIDVLASLSRVMSQVADADHQRAAARVRALLAAHERRRDLISLGAYVRGTEPLVDQAIDRHDELLSLLRQGPHDHVPLEVTRAQLVDSFSR